VAPVPRRGTPAACSAHRTAPPHAVRLTPSSPAHRTPHAPACDKTSPCRSTTQLSLIQPARAVISELNTTASHWPPHDTTCACQLAGHRDAARRVASTASLPLTSCRPPLLQAGRNAIAAGKHELRVLDPGQHRLPTPIKWTRAAPASPPSRTGLPLSLPSLQPPPPVPSWLQTARRRRSPSTVCPRPR
jgi:hypothetical protein